MHMPFPLSTTHATRCPEYQQMYYRHVNLARARLMQVPKHSMHAHALPAAGGASGVAESIVEFAKVKDATMVIVGSRGLGSFRR